MGDGRPESCGHNDRALTTACGECILDIKITAHGAKQAHMEALAANDKLIRERDSLLLQLSEVQADKELFEKRWCDTVDEKERFERALGCWERSEPWEEKCLCEEIHRDGYPGATCPSCKVKAHIESKLQESNRLYDDLKKAAEWALRGLEGLTHDEAKRRDSTFEMCDYSFTKNLRATLQQPKRRTCCNCISPAACRCQCHERDCAEKRICPLCTHELSKHNDFGKCCVVVGPMPDLYCKCGSK